MQYWSKMKKEEMKKKEGKNNESKRQGTQSCQGKFKSKSCADFFMLVL